jgi:flagellar biosynthetic protein FlhB
MAEQEQNRSEPASPFKLREAQKRGSVAKSLELNSFLLLSGFVGVLFFAGWHMVQRQLTVDQAILAQAHLVSYEWSSLFRWFSALTFNTLLTIAPFLLMLLIVGPVANIMQTGPIFSFYPLKPDWDRINPATGFKRLFSVKLLFEAIKTLVKLVLFGLVLYFFVKQLIVPLLGYMHVDPRRYPHMLLDLAVSLIFKIILVLAVIALFDLAYTRWDFLNKMKMSRRELREEVKRREGDPRVRSKIRELQKETLKRSKALRRLPEADVLITNPTHLAVAIRYERTSMLAPEVVAKGAGELASKMRLIARRHGIPIVEDRALARKLFRTVDIEQAIPESLYEPVARILIRLLPARPNSAAQRFA